MASKRRVSLMNWRSRGADGFKSYIHLLDDLYPKDKDSWNLFSGVIPDNAWIGEQLGKDEGFDYKLYVRFLEMAKKSKTKHQSQLHHNRENKKLEEMPVKNRRTLRRSRRRSLVDRNSSLRESVTRRLSYAAEEGKLSSSDSLNSGISSSSISSNSSHSSDSSEEDNSLEGKKFRFCADLLNIWSCDCPRLLELIRRVKAHGLQCKEVSGDTAAGMEAHVMMTDDFYDALLEVVKEETPGEAKDNKQRTQEERDTLLKLKEDAVGSLVDIFARDNSVVDFIAPLMQLERLVSGGKMEDRIRLFFELYDPANTGNITARELSYVLNNGDENIAQMIDFAEDFMKHLDEDGDGGITVEEFKEALKLEPLILEMFASSINDTDMTDDQTNTYRNLLHRANFTWKDLRALWAVFQPSMTVEGDTAWTTITDYYNALTPYLNPPQPEDGPLLAAVLKTVVDMPREEPKVDVTGLLKKAGTVLQKAHFGISDVENKADFYFQMFNIDGDHELSRDEIYAMLYSKMEDGGAQIMEISEALDVIDVDGDGLISFDEFVQASRRDPRLTKYFVMN